MRYESKGEYSKKVKICHQWNGNIRLQMNQIDRNSAEFVNLNESAKDVDCASLEGICMKVPMQAQTACANLK
jgi:hypothetical protein